MESTTIPKTAKKATSGPKAKTAKAAAAPATGEFAVIETGGKQYQVRVGDVVKIEKLPGTFTLGDKITFDKVLVVDNGSDTTIGTPYISGAQVHGSFQEAGRNKTILVVKYKQKSRYMKRNGHRQPFMKVKIEGIK